MAYKLASTWKHAHIPLISILFKLKTNEYSFRVLLYVIGGSVALSACSLFGGKEENLLRKILVR